MSEGCRLALIPWRCVKLFRYNIVCDTQTAGLTDRHRAIAYTALKGRTVKMTQSTHRPIAGFAGIIHHFQLSSVSASEVTTIWRYANVYIIIIIINSTVLSNRLLTPSL